MGDMKANKDKQAKRQVKAANAPAPVAADVIPGAKSAKGAPAAARKK